MVTRAWLLAIRPKTLAAGVAPVLAGTGLAVADGVFVRGAALAALGCAVFVQVATNLANDYFDFFRGADTEDRVGPARTTQQGLLSPSAVFGGMSVALVLAAGFGGYLAGVAGWPVFVVGAACLACAVAYTGGPWPLAYHGLGELFVFVFFGLVAVTGTYYVQALQISPDAILAGAGLGAFSTAVLVVNNLRDRKTDAVANKRTLAVRMGDKFSAIEYQACLGFAAGIPAGGILGREWPLWTLLSLMALPGCLGAWSAVASFAKPGADSLDRRTLNPALGTTARGVAIYGAGLAVGFVAGAF